jgi:glutathione S-transferase
MSLVLYYSPGACSLAPHIVLEELGANYNLELVSVADGATQREPYLTINSKGRVPALRIDKEACVLTESVAILTYLGRRSAAHPLLPPAGTKAEARCYEWLAWLSGWVHAVGFGLIWRPVRFTADSRQYEALQASGRLTVEAAFGEVERQLADGRDWAIPWGYSVVDPFLLVFYRWGYRIGLSMHTQYPAWSAMADKLAQRSAVKRTLEQERISLRY